MLHWFEAHWVAIWVGNGLNYNRGPAGYLGFFYTS